MWVANLVRFGVFGLMVVSFALWQQSGYAGAFVGTATLVYGWTIRD